MLSKSRFADEIGEHVRNVLLHDDVADLARAAKPDIDEAMGRLQRLFTLDAGDTPFRIRQPVDAASPASRRTTGFTDTPREITGTPREKFASPICWHARGPRPARGDAARGTPAGHRGKLRRGVVRTVFARPVRRHAIAWPRCAPRVLHAGTRIVPRESAGRLKA
ncbi:hypothetical protein ACVBGC_23370 [Burkholderia stagnalis]